MFYVLRFLRVLSALASVGAFAAYSPPGSPTFASLFSDEPRFDRPDDGMFAQFLDANEPQIQCPIFAADVADGVGGLVEQKTHPNSDLPIEDRGLSVCLDSEDNYGADGGLLVFGEFVAAPVPQLPSCSPPKAHASGSVQKKGRPGIPERSAEILKDWMLSPEHIDFPYPTQPEKKELAEQAGISTKQLTVWFTNARKRIWIPERERRGLPAELCGRRRREVQVLPALEVVAEEEAAASEVQVLPVLEEGSELKQDVAADDDDDDDDDDESACQESGLNPPRWKSLPPEAQEILSRWMFSPEHSEHPYPRKDEKEALAKEANVTVKQLTVWFTNARKRSWIPWRKGQGLQVLSYAAYNAKKRANPDGAVDAGPSKVDVPEGEESCEEPRCILKRPCGFSTQGQ